MLTTLINRCLETFHTGVHDPNALGHLSTVMALRQQILTACMEADIVTEPYLRDALALANRIDGRTSYSSSIWDDILDDLEAALAITTNVPF